MVLINLDHLILLTLDQPKLLDDDFSLPFRLLIR